MFVKNNLRKYLYPAANTNNEYHFIEKYQKLGQNKQITQIHVKSFVRQQISNETVYRRIDFLSTISTL